MNKIVYSILFGAITLSSVSASDTNKIKDEGISEAISNNSALYEKEPAKKEASIFLDDCEDMQKPEPDGFEIIEGTELDACKKAATEAELNNHKNADEAKMNPKSFLTTAYKYTSDAAKHSLGYAYSLASDSANMVKKTIQKKATKGYDSLKPVYTESKKLIEKWEKDIENLIKDTKIKAQKSKDAFLAAAYKYTSSAAKYSSDYAYSLASNSANIIKEAIQESDAYVNVMKGYDSLNLMYTESKKLIEKLKKDIENLIKDTKVKIQKSKDAFISTAYKYTSNVAKYSSDYAYSFASNSANKVKKAIQESDAYVNAMKGYETLKPIYNKVNKLSTKWGQDAKNLVKEEVNDFSTQAILELAKYSLISFVNPSYNLIRIGSMAINFNKYSIEAKLIIRLGQLLSTWVQDIQNFTTEEKIELTKPTTQEIELQDLAKNDIKEEAPKALVSSESASDKNA